MSFFPLPTSHISHLTSSIQLPRPNEPFGTGGQLPYPKGTFPQPSHNIYLFLKTFLYLQATLFKITASNKKQAMRSKRWIIQLLEKSPILVSTTQ